RTYRGLPYRIRRYQVRFFVLGGVRHDVLGRHFRRRYFLRRVEQSATQHRELTLGRLDNRPGLGNSLDAPEIAKYCRHTDVDPLDTAPLSGRPAHDVVLESINSCSFRMPGN